MPNKSGSLSVHVIDKSSGSYKVVKTIGSSTDPQQVDQPIRQANQWISHHLGQSEFDFIMKSSSIALLLRAFNK